MSPDPPSGYAPELRKKIINFHHSSFVKLFCKAHLFLKRKEKLDVSVHTRPN